MIYQGATNTIERKPKGLRPQILIVDDQISDLHLLNSVFDFLNCQIDRAMDGSEAISKLHKKNYDLVVLDLLMPIKDGSEVMAIMDRKHKGHETNPKPLVIYTGLASETIHIPTSRYFRLIDIWQKPSDLSKILKQADNLIKRIRG